MQLVTAVILSLENQNFLRSQLVYYANKPVHLILADGSDSDWGSGEAGKVGQMSWEYFRISGPNTYWLRMQMAITRVNTQYMFLLDDEDCILWTGIVRAITFLQSHPSFSSSGGVVAFTTHTGKRLGLSSAPRFQEYELSHPNDEIRLKQLLSDRKSAHLYYQIHTTRNISALVNEVVKLPPHFELASLAKYLPVFLALTGTWKAEAYPFQIRRVAQSRSYIHRVEAFSDADSRQMATTVCRAASQLPEQVRQTRFLTSTESVMEIIHNRYKKFKIAGETHHQTWSQKLALRLLFPLFDHFPKIYGLIRPNGLRTTNKYADFLKCSSQDWSRDLRHLEQLWIRYPNGIAVNQLRTWLECAAE